MASALRFEAERGRVVIGSAGTHGLTGRGMDEYAAGQLIALGGDPSGFQARRVDANLMLAADLVLTMTRDVRAEVLKEQPRAMKRTFTLLEFSHLCREAIGQDAEIFTMEDLMAFAVRNRSAVAGLPQDIEDPIGRSVEVHHAVAETIAAHVRVVAALLIPLLRD